MLHLCMTLGDASGPIVPWDLDHVLELTASLKALSTEGFLAASSIIILEMLCRAGGEPGVPALMH